MKTIVLPDELPIEKLQFVQVYDYNTKQEITKANHFKPNTFSFLAEGTKEVFFDSSALSIDNSSFLLMKAGHCLMTEKLSTVHNYRNSFSFQMK
jgi:hypothetical protein